MQYQDILEYKMKHPQGVKFLLLFILFMVYFIYVSYKFGIEEGFLVTSVLWSFFVLCTPIADAGFLLDFPIRLILNIRMFITEIIVWIVAIGLNLFCFFLYPEVYTKTKLLTLFYHILEQPFPFWGIIVICGIGTFLSIYFADEILDVVSYKEKKIYFTHLKKYKILVMTAIIIICIIFY